MLLGLIHPPLRPLRDASQQEERFDVVIRLKFYGLWYRGEQNAVFPGKDQGIEKRRWNQRTRAQRPPDPQSMLPNVGAIW